MRCENGAARSHRFRALADGSASRIEIPSVEGPIVFRAASPVYLKFGLRNAPAPREHRARSGRPPRVERRLDASGDRGA